MIGESVLDAYGRAIHISDASRRSYGNGDLMMAGQDDNLMLKLLRGVKGSRK